MRRVLDVKFTGHLALLKAIKLQDGDIFSVPGSVSTTIGAAPLQITPVKLFSSEYQIVCWRRTL